MIQSEDLSCSERAPGRFPVVLANPMVDAVGYKVALSTTSTQEVQLPEEFKES